MNYKRLISGVLAASIVFSSDIRGLNILRKNSGNGIGSVAAYDSWNDNRFYEMYTDAEDVFGDYAFGARMVETDIGGVYMRFMVYRYHAEFVGLNGYYSGNYGEKYDIVIPAKVEGVPVSAVNFFENDDDGLSLYEFANSAVSRVSSVTVEEGSKYLRSVDGVLYDKNMSKLIWYPAASERKTFTVPESVTEIGKAAFAFSSFRSADVYEEDDVESRYRNFRSMADSYGFSDPENCLYFSSSLTRIDDLAFLYNGLYNVLIPDTVEYIGMRAFYCSTALRTMCITSPFCSIYDRFDTFTREMYSDYGNDKFSDKNTGIKYDPYELYRDMKIVVPEVGNTRKFLENYGYNVHYVYVNLRIRIDEKAFPDDQFRRYLLMNADRDHDGYLDEYELGSIHELRFEFEAPDPYGYYYGPKENIRSLKGIEFFRNLSILELVNCDVQELDIRRLEYLREIKCTGGKLRKLYLEYLPSLFRLDVSGNMISDMELYGLQQLSYIDCSSNALTGFQFVNSDGMILSDPEKMYKKGIFSDGSSHIDYFDCSDNKISDIGFIGNCSIKEFYCSGNELTELDISCMTALNILDCSSNRIEKLTGICVGGLLDCHDNRLRTLDLRNSRWLQYLDCSGNMIIDLDLDSMSMLSCLNWKTEIYLDYFPECGISLDFAQGNTAGSAPFRNIGEKFGGIEKIEDGIIIPEKNATTVSYSPVRNDLSDLPYGFAYCSAYNYDRIFCISDHSAPSVILHSYSGTLHPDLYPDGICDLCGSDLSADQNIPISEEIFPDPEFRRYLTESFDTENKGYVSVSDVSDMVIGDSYRISSFRGAENFTELTDITLYTAFENNVDMTGILYLRRVNVISTVMYTDPFSTAERHGIDLSGCLLLEEIMCRNCEADSISAVNCRNLEVLDCTCGSVSSLDLSGCSSLKDLYCDNNKIRRLDLSENYSLESVHCEMNEMEELIFSGADTQSGKYDISDSRYYRIKELFCSQNSLTGIDLSALSELEYLEISDNQLSSLDVSGCTVLGTLYGRNNRFLSIDVSGLKYLSNFNCDTVIYLESLPECGFTLADLGDKNADFTRTQISYDMGFVHNSKYYPVSDNYGDHPGNRCRFGYSYLVSSDSYYLSMNVVLEAESGGHYDGNSDDICDICGEQARICINEMNFPDSNFMLYVHSYFDYDRDGYLSSSEISNVRTIDLSGYGPGHFSSLKGIELFTGLQDLDISYVVPADSPYCEKQSILDLRALRNLRTLKCSGCGFDGILIGSPVLESFEGERGSLRSLDLSMCVSLRSLNCRDNHIESLDTGNCRELSILNCTGNPLKSFVFDPSCFSRYGEYDVRSLVYADSLRSCGFRLSELGYDFDADEICDISGAVTENGLVIPKPESDDTMMPSGGVIRFSRIIRHAGNDEYGYGPENDIAAHYEIYYSAISEHQDEDGDNICDFCGKRAGAPCEHVASYEPVISDETLVIPQTYEEPAVYCRVCRDCGEPLKEDTFIYYTVQDIQNRMHDAEEVLMYDYLYTEEDLAVLEDTLVFASDLPDGAGQPELESRYMVLSDILAHMEKRYAVVSVVSVPEGAGTVSGGGRYRMGERMYLEAANAGDYAFEGWYIGDTRIGDSMQLDIEVTEPGEITVSAHYLKKIPEPGPELRIDRHPEDQHVSEGGKAVFTVEAEGTDLQYQWQYQSVGYTKWTNITQAQGKTNRYATSVTEAKDGRKFRCIVTRGEESLTSEAGTIIFKEDLAVTKQPQDQKLRSGEKAVFTVETNYPDVTYQWQYQSVGYTKWTNITQAQGKTNRYATSVTEAKDGRKFRCIVTRGEESVTSEAGAIIFINEPAAEFAITKQPQDQKLRSGEKAVFTVETNYPDATYQWQYQSVGYTKWTNITQAQGKTNRYETSVTEAKDGRRFRCIVSNGTESIESDAAAITVCQENAG